MQNERRRLYGLGGMRSKGAIKVKDAADRLGHSTRWVRDRIGTEFEGFKHSRSDMTVSVQSIEKYEDRVRISIRQEKGASGE